jgi:hypothetical protein
VETGADLKKVLHSSCSIDALVNATISGQVRVVVPRDELACCEAVTAQAFDDATGLLAHGLRCCVQSLCGHHLRILRHPHKVSAFS